MRYRVRVTVLDKKAFSEFRDRCCPDPGESVCSCYQIGDQFLFDPDRDRNCFRNCGLNTLIRTSGDPRAIPGGPVIPHCALAWDVLSRFIAVGLAGGSFGGNGIEPNGSAVLCCPDGTRPVVFRVERLDAREAPALQLRSTEKADSGDASRSERMEEGGTRDPERMR